MALEIERRFLVKSRLLPTLGEGRRIEQVYLSADPSVRVRLIDDAEAFITIKTEGGLVREEYGVPDPGRRRARPDAIDAVVGDQEDALQTSDR